MQDITTLVAADVVIIEHSVKFSLIQIYVLIED